MKAIATWTGIVARLRLRICAWLRTGYTRSLKAEVSRLRAENHALVNSIFGVAGIAPGLDARGWTLEAGEKTNADSSSRRRKRATSRNDNIQSNDPLTAARLCGTASVAPLRRRSWQQIGRAMEIKDARAARRERESNTEAFPAPRTIVPRV